MSRQRLSSARTMWDSNQAPRRTRPAQEYGSKEKLREQNMQLKQSNHELKEQLSKTRAQTDTLKRKTKECNKQLDVEFQKEELWQGSHAHMARGIRHQYDQLKQKYQEKCSHVQTLMQNTSVAKAQERSAYIQALEQENSRLIRILQNKRDQKGVKLEQINDKLVRYQDKITVYKAIIQRHTIKEAFLERMIKQKQQNISNVTKLLNRVKKQKQSVQEMYRSSKQQKQNIIQNNRKYIEQLKEQMKKYNKIQKQILLNQLQIKQSYVQKLQKQISFLSALLTYWKPVQQINRLRGLQQQRNTYEQQSVTTPLQQCHIQTEILHRTQTKQNAVGDLTSQQILNTSNLSQAPQKALRVQQRAERRHSADAIKCRRVQVKELQGLIELVRYRCIAAGVNLIALQQQFEWVNDVTLSQQDNAWREKYISLRQAAKLFEGGIFRLNVEDSTLLARYLVEDSETEYVYCDSSNENLRSIVKSIVRNVVGQYKLIEEGVREKASLLISRYKVNLESQLRQVATSGFISKKRLSDTFSGFGMETNETINNFIFSFLASHSSTVNMDHLPYQILFQI